MRAHKLIGSAFIGLSLVILSWHWNFWTSSWFATGGIMAYQCAIDAIYECTKRQSAGGK